MVVPVGNSGPRRIGAAEALGYLGVAIAVAGAVLAINSGVTGDDRWGARALLYGAVLFVAAAGSGIALAGRDRTGARTRVVAVALVVGLLAFALALYEVLRGLDVLTNTITMVDASGQVVGRNSSTSGNAAAAAAAMALLAAVALIRTRSTLLVLPLLAGDVAAALAGQAAFPDSGALPGLIAGAVAGVYPMLVSVVPRVSRIQAETLRCIGLIVLGVTGASVDLSQPGPALGAVAMGVIAIAFSLTAISRRGATLGGGAVAVLLGMLRSTSEVTHSFTTSALVASGVGVVVVLAAAVAARDRRPAGPQAPFETDGTPPPGAVISDDRLQWWDAIEARWRRTTISEDGGYFFDGTSWRAV